MKQPGAITNLVQMTSLAPFRVYRGVDNIIDNTQNPNTWRASATYVTGAHNLKVGYRGAYHVEQTEDDANDARYTLTDLTFLVPGMYSATMRIAPWQQSNRTEYHAFFAQDQWTHGRLTLQGALRYDRAWSWFPSEHNGAPETSGMECQADHLPGDEGRDRLQRHHAACGRGLRRLRQREDLAEGERRQVSPEREQPGELHGRATPRSTGATADAARTFRCRRPARSSISTAITCRTATCS